MKIKAYQCYYVNIVHAIALDIKYIYISISSILNLLLGMKMKLYFISRSWVPIIVAHTNKTVETLKHLLIVLSTCWNRNNVFQY